MIVLIVFVLYFRCFAAITLNHYRMKVLLSFVLSYLQCKFNDIYD